MIVLGSYSLINAMTRVYLGLNLICVIEDRTQHVSLNKSLSDASNIIHGVPQGSILGPLLLSDLHK